MILGGPAPIGREVDVRAGDIVVLPACLPAGTGHRKLEASSGFLVVGAYPHGEDVGISRAALTSTQLQTMKKIAFPLSDPLSGPRGPLPKLWT
jgi:uncharacterized protein YjlB